VFDALTGAELRVRDLLCHSLVVGALSADLVRLLGDLLGAEREETEAA
jgi:hypothetical protein